MFVCICNQVTDKQIRRSVEDGVCSFESLKVELSVGTCCGKCKSCAKKVLREAMQENACAQASPCGFGVALSAA
jgi:bacterioferritin-associated ferredoxin